MDPVSTIPGKAGENQSKDGSQYKFPVRWRDGGDYCGRSGESVCV